MRITFLGTSAGTPTPDRGLPSVMLEVDGEQILLDCGEGTQRQMMKAGASLGKKMKIFITHMHGDHIFGLPGLIQTMNLINRTHPLEVFGPPGIRDFIEQTTVPAMCEPAFELAVHEVGGGEIISCRKYTVTCALGEHSVPNIGYRIAAGGSLGRFLPEKARALGVPEGPLWGALKAGKPVVLEEGREVKPADVLGEPVRGVAVVYSGDTRPSDEIVRLAEGADLLIHESTFSEELRERAWTEGHSTARGAAQVASMAGVKRLILTHFSARYPDASLLEGEARAIFSDSFAAKDLEAYELKT